MDERLLDSIELPSDLRKLQPPQLPGLCEELRDFIIEAVACNPGHLGASLGTVELTVALHYVFDTPKDKVVWDVGHQAYGHKILTGRKSLFHSNRKYKGISGFPKMAESPFDSFGTGHSSTSISAALGMAQGFLLNGIADRQVVAVIGDGSMTGGLAFEGLNNAGMLKPNILVILNDNNIAIDPNVGALKDYLLDITTSATYNKVREDIWHLMGRMKRYAPHLRSMVRKVDGSLKSFLLKHSNLFEALNFRYFGPVDGHDVVHLVDLLKDLKTIPGPKLLHVVTTKGKGLRLAEENQTTYHAPGQFNRVTGEIFPSVAGKAAPPRFQDVFGETLLELAWLNPKIVGITPAMPSGSSLNIMMEAMPHRTFDVGIAEQHAVTFSAGSATTGMIPFCNIYSTFIQRAYDQVIHDVALQRLQVVFCLDRGGLVGADGPTHHGAFDMAFMRCIPNLVISSPMDEVELRNLMYTAQLPDQPPFVIRYPRGNGSLTDWRQPFSAVPIGKGRLLVEGVDLVFLSIGPVGSRVVRVCRRLLEKGIRAAAYDLRFVKPLDEE
jgi:1-deoxy-D-xylulose-5-phosphate synthase